MGLEAASVFHPNRITSAPVGRRVLIFFDGRRDRLGRHEIFAE
jgi:hypothetical protein